MLIHKNERRERGPVQVPTDYADLHADFADGKESGVKATAVNPQPSQSYQYQRDLRENLRNLRETSLPTQPSITHYYGA